MNRSERFFFPHIFHQIFSLFQEQQEQWPRLEARMHGMSRQAFLESSLRQATTGTKNKKRGPTGKLHGYWRDVSDYYCPISWWFAEAPSWLSYVFLYTFYLIGVEIYLAWEWAVCESGRHMEEGKEAKRTPRVCRPTSGFTWKFSQRDSPLRCAWEQKGEHNFWKSSAEISIVLQSETETLPRR